LKPFAASVLQQRHRRVCSLGRRVAELHDEDLHRLRIRAKKLRYTAEFCAGLFPGRRARAYAEALSDLQDVLGILNDCATAVRLLRELAPKARDEGDAAAILHGWIAGERHRQLQALPAAWEAFRRHGRFWTRALPAAPSAASGSNVSRSDNQDLKTAERNRHV
jgi:CHAD domain-containing protein